LLKLPTAAQEVLQSQQCIYFMSPNRLNIEEWTIKLRGKSGAAKASGTAVQALWRSKKQCD